MSIKIGDMVKVHRTGDDRLDWAAGLIGEVIRKQLVTVPSGNWDKKGPIYYEFHRVIVRTSQGEVTVNSDEVTQI